MRPVHAVWIATAVYAVIFFLLGADRYATFHSGTDLGIFTQAIASAFHGFSDTFEGGSHFAFHFSPILYLCVPFLWLAHSALALVAIQAIATALVAPALYLIARKRTSERNAAILACIALLYPPLQGVTFTEFHENGFVPAAVAWLLWAIDARRFGTAAALLILTLCIKEDQAPAMAFLGLCGLAYFGGLVRDDKGKVAVDKAGVVFSAVAILLSVVTFVAYFALIVPAAGGQAGWTPEHFYHWGGSGAPQIPVDRQIIGRLTYLLEAFVPLAFVPLRSRVMLLSLPGFAEVLGSREPLTYTMGQHYAAVWIPYVLVAFAVAAAQLLDAQGRRGIQWIRASAILSVLVLIFFNPLHLGHFLRLPNASDRAASALIRRIPSDAGVGTYGEIYAHLGFFPRATVGLRNRPEYVIYDTAYKSAYWDATVLPHLDQAMAAGVYHVLVREDGVMLLQRRVNLR